MDWKQVCIKTTEQASDFVSSLLLDAGANGIEITGGEMPAAKLDEYLAPKKAIEPVQVIAYYSEHEFEKSLIYIKGRTESLKYTANVGVGSLEIIVNTVKDTDWNENFKEHFTTFRAAGNIIIKPTWEDYKRKKEDIVIEMDPGLAFGSGTHETTKMCLELVQKYMQKGAAVLDVGCGSGILGIACAKLGAKQVLALDHDNVSVKVTKDNAAANDIKTLDVRKSDLLQNADNKKYDIVLANIIADIIIRLNDKASEYLAQDAVYIVSGIIESRLEDVTASLKQNRLEVIEVLSSGDWRALAVKRIDV